ncbi:GNAT family N-acetyltransferase [Massilia sp. NR 4-1]|uniref:GNAT family N-acetyltransferase n=1 Tax=Massilia sp. NR 4-1 TaxID=1678028 RepID=UPI0009E5F2F5|nr:GNAT family N-acetyltransferase [Massilia sp. NR 4-1]
MSWTLYPATQFAAHAARWAECNRRSTASPLLEPDFVHPLLREFGNGDEQLAWYERQGELLAMGIVARRRRGVWETFQPSQAPVSLWMHAPGLNLSTLLAELTRKLPGMPLMLGLTQRDPQLEPRPAPGGCLRTVDYIDTARITLAGSFEDYWNARGKNLRNNLKKQRSKLQKEGVVTRMQISRAPQEMAAAVADYGRLESAGWKAQLGTAIHPENAQGRFYTAMLEGFARRGAAAVYRYWFDNQLVAMDLCIEGDGCMIVLKTTYDETVPSSLSPTMLMREECCQQLFAEQRFERLEFYGKVMEWHTRWTDEIRTMYHVNHYRWPVLLQLHAIANQRAALRGQRPAPAPAPAQSLPHGNPSTE